jgi:uncharacterized membrane protein
MFVFAATAHFNKMKHDLAAMIPSYFPQPLLLIYITGVLELLGAVGLILPEFRRIAGICLIALLIGMFVANVNAAQKGVSLRGKPATPLWLRTPMLVLFYCSPLVVNSTLGTGFGHKLAPKPLKLLSSAAWVSTNSPFGRAVPGSQA